MDRHERWGSARSVAVLASALLMAACAPATPPPAEHDHPTIVSLNPCIDAILLDVAAPEQILALSHYSHDPSASSVDVARAQRFRVTGGTAEEVLALQPDIVLASSFIAPATRAALERLGLQVETFGSPGTLDESAQQVRRVAALAGQRQAGERLVRQMAAVPSPETLRRWSALLWQPGQIVAGNGTMVSENLRWAGLDSHSARRGLGQADYVSLENVLADPPDILLVAGGAPGQTHPLLNIQRGTLVADFSPSLLYCGGPTVPKARNRLLHVRKIFERDFYRAQQF